MDNDPTNEKNEIEAQTEHERPKLTEGFDKNTEERLDYEISADDTLTKVSKYISAIFSPLLMPTYCIALAMWLTVLSEMPEYTRLTISVVILFITALIPMAMILGLIKAGRVSNLDITDRRQRVIPVTATALCYVAAVIYLHRINAPDWMCMIFVGAFAAGVICALISPWWKISAHGCAAGGLIGLMLRFAVSDLGIYPMIWWIAGVIVLGGIIGVARMALKSHTPTQFFVGEIVGALCVFLATGLPVPFASVHIMPL